MRCPVVGRVSMDLIALDITDLPQADVQRGDLVTLIGDGIDIDEFASWAPHHQLRRADASRPALPSRVEVLTQL